MEKQEKRKCDVEVGGRKNFIKTRRQKCGILRKRFALHMNDSWISALGLNYKKYVRKINEILNK